jgi:glutamyl-tRNA reductase
LTARPAPSTGIWCAVADSSTSSAAERSELLKLFSQESARYDRILLETCQRAELYGVGRIRCAASTSVRWLADEDTVRHLLRVAAGLESAVIGENEVLGQVRQAFRKAVAAAPRHPVLQRLFETAVATGRRCRAGRRPNGAGLA